MRKIVLAENRPQSNILRRLDIETLSITRFEGAMCTISFSNASDQEYRIPLEQPQDFNLRILSREHGFTITKIQFFYENGDCSFFCERK